MNPVQARAIEAAAAAFGVETADMLSPRRFRTLVLARNAAARLMQERRFSVLKIGNALGRDHTTIVHGLAQLARRAGDPYVTERLRYARMRLSAAFGGHVPEAERVQRRGPRRRIVRRLDDGRDVLECDHVVPRPSEKPCRTGMRQCIFCPEHPRAAHYRAEYARRKHA